MTGFLSLNVTKVTFQYDFYQLNNSDVPLILPEIYLHYVVMKVFNKNYLYHG